MSIPVTQNTEYFVNGIGSETYPQSIIVKSTLWNLFTSYGSFFLKEYGGNLYKLNYSVRRFALSEAIQSGGSFYTDRFWIWMIDYNYNLILVELEPFVLTSPVVHYTKNVESNVANVSVYLKPNDAVRVCVLDNSVPKQLRTRTYALITDPVPTTTVMGWATTRLDDLSNFVNSPNTIFTLSYSDTASPPNIYASDLSVPTPLNLITTQVGASLNVQTNWDVSVGSDQYVLERDTDSGFGTATTVYTGGTNSFLDTVPTGGTYYYRVKAQVTSLLLESLWSLTANVDVITLTVDFIADVTSGDADLVVNFTDLTSGVPISWNWDFGDGYTSILQNPTHIYTIAGLYTVILSATDGVGFGTETKIDYISVGLHAEYAPTVVTGTGPGMTMQFIDETTGGATSWFWDLGDDHTSTEQNPVHTYDVAGFYTVTLTATRGAELDTIAKTFVARFSMSGLSAARGTLILDGEMVCNGDVQVATGGLVIPVPDKKLMGEYLTYKTGNTVTSNGKGRSITSTTHSIGVDGNILGIGYGFGSDKGPGANSTLTSGNVLLSGYGATHAGLGGIRTPLSVPAPKPIYGNYETPVSLGSGSGYYHNPADYYGTDVNGGGAIKLMARVGYVYVNGIIDMSGMTGQYTGGGSGGSIWIIGWKILGTGRLLAEGGSTSSSYNSGGGGGGYISLWHERTLLFSGYLSVNGKLGGGNGKIYTKEIEPVLEDRFTGSVWNSKWWDHTGSISINNMVTLDSTQNVYTIPTATSKFTVAGNIIADVDFIPDNTQIPVYSASFLLYADANNWAGVARKYNGLYGISSADGIVSSSGIPYDYTDTRFRIVKTGSTFTYQYFDTSSTPHTIYTDIRPELERKNFKVRMGLDKPVYTDQVKTEILRLTPLDEVRQYIETDGTSVDSSSIAFNVIHGTPQMYGLDFYSLMGENKVRWDSSAIFNTPFTLIVTEYYTLTPEDILQRNITLARKPQDPLSVTLNIVHGGSQAYGTDFIINENHIIWRGLNLEGLLSPGDILRAQYLFDPWDVVTFGETAAWGDIVRTMYEWNPPTENSIKATFDNVRIYDGIVSNAETKDSVIYVDSDSGSDTSTGEQLHPLQNLFVATAWAKKGGVVVLYDGTYNPSLIIRKDLTVRGAEGTKPLITTVNVQDTTGSDWETNALSFYGCQGNVDNVTIAGAVNGIRLENTTNFKVTRAEIYDTTTGVKIVNCDPTVMRSRIHDSSTAVDFTSCLSGYAYGNVIYDCSTGVLSRYTKDLRVIANTIDTCQTAIAADSTGLTIVSSNNITNDSTGIRIATDASVGSYNNNYYGTGLWYTRAPDQSSNNISSDPLYADQINKNYRVGVGSPDIGTGQILYDNYLIDFDGASRVDSSDVGAYRFIDGTHVGGTDYYVAPQGDDYLNYGNFSDPFRSLDKAMAVADSTVHIDGGHYDTYYLKLKAQNIDLNTLFIYTAPINHFVSYHTITPGNIVDGYLSLPGFIENREDSSNVAVNVLGGPAQIYGTDYTVEYSNIVWKDLLLEDLIEAGDILRVLYQGVLRYKALNTLILHGHFSNIESDKAIFVSPSGSDSTVLGGDGTNTGGNGTLNRPYRTINMALNNSVNGSNIVALAGEYPIFTGMDNRIIIPAIDRTSSVDKTPKTYFEEFFLDKRFSPLEDTDFNIRSWNYDYAGDSTVMSGGGFLGLTYDGTNTASATSLFSFVNDFEVTAEMRNVMDPLRFTVSAPNHTLSFIFSEGDYTGTINTNGTIYTSYGHLINDHSGRDPFIIEHIQLTANDIRSKSVALSYIPETTDYSNVSVNIVGGTPQHFGDDFYIEDARVKWDGKSLDGDLAAGEILRIIYADRSLSSPVLVQMSLKGSRFNIRAYDTAWHTVLNRDIKGSYHGPWQASFVMDTAEAFDHAHTFGKGYVAKFLVVAESISDTDLSKVYGVKTERKNVVLFNPAQLKIVTDSTLVQGIDGTSYKLSIDATGGSSILTWPLPWTWNVTAGSLPPGLSFSDKNIYGWINGTPTLTGDYTFTVQLTDKGYAGLNTTKDFQLKVV